MQVIRFVIITWGLAAGWAWLLFGQKSATSGIAGGIVLAAITLGVFGYMVRRSTRLSGGHEHVNARLEYHQGFSKNRWKRAKPARGDDGGSELTLGKGF